MLNMSKIIVCKLLQRQTYDILSHKYSFFICCLCLIGLLISAFRFGEQFLQWSKDKGYFSVYWDNLMDKSYQNKLCQYLPIDVVYTWVNGTDPELLYNLGKVKREYEQQLNISRFGRDVNDESTSCPFSHCIQSHLILLRPLLPNSFTIDDLTTKIAIFKDAKEIFPIHSLNPNEKHLSATVVAFDTKEIALNIVKNHHVVIFNVNYTIYPAMLTSEWTAPFSVFLQDVVILTGVHERLNEEKLLSKLPIGLQQYVSQVYLYPDKSLALLKVNDKASQDAVLQMEGNFTIDKKQTSLSAANLLLFIGQGIVSEDISDSRFQDNEELRYSLRSIEKFAPWVRHIFIVTNGQIPSWLNLENPRITIVTHEELYPNKSHLPTFSSPSIETHLHRIPNLSKKFLYLNDDVVFGKEIWPDDFYTHSKGYKVYLSWSVPDCREGCPATWIDDGYCDRPCNNSDCQWDGGDCKNGVSGMMFNNENANVLMWKEESEKLYCSVNCANTWLADRYCDQACNLFDCGFDAGDCGVDNFDKLYQLELKDTIKQYVIPPGIRHAFFNLSNFLKPDRSISDGNYDDNKGVRISSINQKFKVLTLILYANHSEVIQMSVKGIKDKFDYQFEFNVSVNTFYHENMQINITRSPEKIESKSSEKVKLKAMITIPTTTTTVNIEKFDEKLRYPKITRESSLNVDIDRLNTSNIDFPPDIESKVSKIEELYKNGYLTDKGYRKRMYEAVNEFSRQQQRQESNMAAGENGGHKTRGLKSILMSRDDYPIGSFPWEKKYFQEYERLNEHTTVRKGQRRLLDTFGDSLRHVNRLLNREFGFETRKVPAHMPHFVDVDLITDLQSRFAAEFDMTSSHKIRSRDDMQFAFSFFYFVMSDVEVFDIDKLFINYDTDNSGTWSDREIRTLLTQLYDLPLSKENVRVVDAILLNCSQGVDEVTNFPVPPFERYLNSQLPIISRELVKNCDPLIKLIKSKIKSKKKYKYEVVGEEEIAFKMIRNNVSIVIGQLDDIRKKPRKFICLNDDIDHRKPESQVVKSILIDFYESFYPIPSQFELPREYKNRFLTVKELKTWREERDFIKHLTCMALIVLILIILSVVFNKKISRFFRRFKLPRRKLKKIVKRFHDV